MVNEGQQWVHAHDIHPSSHVPHHPEAAGLTEQWDGLSKTQSQCQLGGSTLQGWDGILQKAIYALSQHPVQGDISLTARIQDFENQGWPEG